MAAYCTAAEVRGMLKSDVLSTLIGDETIEDEKRREKLISPIIRKAIADAGAEIDGYLAKRHPLPLSKVPDVIKEFAKDIAVYNLYSRIGINEGEREKNILNRYRAAIKFLELLAEGKVEIGLHDPREAAKSGFVVCSSSRRFSRDQLRGM